jgi:hypothetical protein
MEDYEDGLEQAVPKPSPVPPGGKALDSLVRPALVAGGGGGLVC